jgi:phage terminase small subunit
MKLNPKQIKFCELYVKTGNATQSYIDAGYKVKDQKNAQVNSSQILLNPIVRVYIEQLQKKLSEKVNVDTKMVVTKLAKMAFGDVSDLVEVDDRGMVKLKKGADLSRFDAVSTNESHSDTGSSKSTSIKLKDQLKALDMLCKILGIYERRESDNSRVIRDNAPRVLDALRRFRKKDEPLQLGDGT